MTEIPVLRKLSLSVLCGHGQDLLQLFHTINNLVVLIAFCYVSRHAALSFCQCVGLLVHNFGPDLNIS